MNYGTLKTICLQKLFAIEGQTAEENDNTRSYLSALPAAVNEAMALLTTGTAGGRLPPRSIEIPVHPHQTDPDRHREWTVRDLRELDCRFYRMVPGQLFFRRSQQQKPYRRMGCCWLEGDSRLWLACEEPGIWTVYYYVYPKWDNAETQDGEELDISPEMASLVPLYVASQLYKDDDLSVATQYRNEFEVGRAMLLTPETGESGEEFSSVSGWI